MITKVKITHRDNTPIKYLGETKILPEGSEYEFKSGVNIIVGPNGSGKSTLLNLIRKYILINIDKQDAKNVDSLFDYYTKSDKDEDHMFDGIDVYSDYRLASFNFVHMDELSKGGSDRWLDSFSSFSHSFASMNASTGEAVKVALHHLFSKMFDKKTNLKFPIEELQKTVEEGNSWWKANAQRYLEYVKKHEIPFKKEEAEFTVIMDEPDRNLDLLNIDEIYSILSIRKEQTQIISVVHNPLLIYKLSKCDDVNIIEMENGYVNKIKKAIDKIVSKI